MGFEVFPGTSDLRLTTQLSGRKVFADEPALDFTEIYNLTGEIEKPFVAFGLPWSTSSRFSIRLDERAYYFNPRLVLLAWEPSEVFLAAHLFSGANGTAEGFYHSRDTIVLGWQARF